MIRTGAAPFLSALLFAFGVFQAVGQERPKITKLQIKDLVVGKGKPVGEGDLVFVTYIGSLNSNGLVFDRNDSPKGNPLSFTIGAQPLDVIPGWDQGIRGMKVGGKRVLGVPANLGYGERANGKIPANSDLLFEVTMLDVVRKGEEGVYDSTDLKVGTGPGAKKGDRITVNYTGRLVNGKLFDSTYVRKMPVEFTLGVKEALDGIDVGLIGMKVGGKRRLRLPPALAMGSAGSTFIPANTILIYEIELIKIKPKK